MQADEELSAMEILASLKQPTGSDGLQDELQKVVHKPIVRYCLRELASTFADRINYQRALDMNPTFKDWYDKALDYSTRREQSLIVSLKRDGVQCIPTIVSEAKLLSGVLTGDSKTKPTVPYHVLKDAQCDACNI